MDDSDLKKILKELEQQSAAPNFIANVVGAVVGLTATALAVIVADFLHRQYHWF